MAGGPASPGTKHQSFAGLQTWLAGGTQVPAQHARPSVRYSACRREEQRRQDTGPSDTLLDDARWTQTPRPWRSSALRKQTRVGKARSPRTRHSKSPYQARPLPHRAGNLHPAHCSASPIVAAAPRAVPPTPRASAGTLLPAPLVNQEQLEPEQVPAPLWPAPPLSPHLSKPLRLCPRLRPRHSLRTSDAPPCSGDQGKSRPWEGRGAGPGGGRGRLPGACAGEERAPRVSREQCGLRLPAEVGRGARRAARDREGCLGEPGAGSGLAVGRAGCWGKTQTTVPQGKWASPRLPWLFRSLP